MTHMLQYISIVKLQYTKRVCQTLTLILFSHHLSVGYLKKSSAHPIYSRPPQTKQANKDRCWQITNRRSRGKVQFDIFTFQSGGKFGGGGKV